MNKLTAAKRAAILCGLVEGGSIRAVGRMTGADKDTVMQLLVEVGEFCSVYQDHMISNLKSTRVEADEIWSFVGAKAKSVTKSGQGDIWTWTALDADSKLMISWMVGQRSQAVASDFMQDVASRLANRVQLTTDGLTIYLPAVEKAFGWNGTDFAPLFKQYGTETGVSGRYGTHSVCTGADKVETMGRPNIAKVSTSYVERANLTMRMGMRRFTRLTNEFSKKAEKHAHAVSLHFTHYNYYRPHQTLTKAAKGIKTTPAMSPGLTDRVWTVENVLEKMEGMIGGDAS